MALDGRHALVTGGAKGIGRAIADRLAASGASVALIGRDPVALAASGYRHAVADVTDDDAFCAAIERLGPFDILVNNAGAAVSAPFKRHTRADWDSMLAVNLSACFVAIQAVLPRLVERGWGRIISIASTAGLKGYGYTAGYCAAKHGLVGLTRALAVEAARTGVTVNAVCPGFTDTAMADRAAAVISDKTGQSAADARTALASTNPQGRLIHPGEVAAAVAYLASEDAAGLTGQCLAVAGGEVM